MYFTAMSLGRKLKQEREWRFTVASMEQYFHHTPFNFFGWVLSWTLDLGDLKEASWPKGYKYVRAQSSRLFYLMKNWNDFKCLKEYVVISKFYCASNSESAGLNWNPHIDLHFNKYPGIIWLQNTGIGVRPYSLIVLYNCKRPRGKWIFKLN